MTADVRRNSELVERAQHAKTPVATVAGPYGHPFHPLFVTVPIGAWVCSLIFDIATKVNDGGSAALTEATYWLIGIGIVGALVAALFGLMDLVRIPRGTRALRLGLTHLTLNLAVVGMYIGNFLWRRDDYDVLTQVETGQLVLSAIALGVLAASGWIGGMLAYRYGVRVADENTQLQGYT